MKNKLMMMAGLAVAALAPLAANAANVAVQDIWASGAGEWNLYNSGSGPDQGSGIMEYLYGADFTRLNDSSVTEWTGISGTVSVSAVYAGAQQNLYTTGLGGSPVSSLISSPGGTIGGTPARGLVTATFTPASNPFLFLDNTTPSGYAAAYSDPALNAELGGVVPAGTVRMVAFEVTGYLTTAGDLGGGYTTFGDPTYVIAFEDGYDADYNDLVVEISGVRPVPDGGTTAGLLGLALGGCALFTRKMKRA